MATATSVVGLDVKAIPDIASGVRQIMEVVRDLRWAPDGIDAPTGRSPAQWGQEGACGFAAACVGSWKVTVALGHRLGRDGLGVRRIERWADGLVRVEPCPRERAWLEQEYWSRLPEGELRDEAWEATRAEDALHDLEWVIEEVVRYLLGLHQLPGAWDAAREAVIRALREDISRWTREDATEAELCGLVWRARWGEC